MTEQEINYIKLVRNDSPLSEWCFGYFLLLIQKDKVSAQEWFKKAFKHCNGLGLLIASGEFALIFDYLQEYDWYEWSVKCLRRSAWRQFKLAKRMLKEMEKEPFQFPKC